MARDKYHEVVRNALIKDGWEVIKDPYALKLEGYNDVYIDMAAEKIIQATKGMDKIAVEVKSFIGISPITDLYEAIGKYEIYDSGLETQEPDRVLFLAVPETAWHSLFELPFAKKLRRDKKIRIIVYNISEEKIDKWIK